MILNNSKFKFLFCLILLTVSFNFQAETKVDSNITSANIIAPITVSADGVFMRDNKPYYGIGINYFNAFYRTIQNNYDKTYTYGLKYLGDNKIPFIRFSVNGFWPNDLLLYKNNKTLYFSLLDQFVASAETNNIGLIPSLFWFYAAVPDLMGEHINQWGNPNSKTIAFMRTYTTDLVSRYKNSPAIWGWEFGNEVNAYCDLLDQAKNFLPKVSVMQGTPASRTIEDAMTTSILQVALNEFATTIRLIDPDRPIFSGNSTPASNMYHRYKFGNWNTDSSTDFTLLLNAQNPISLGTLGLHLYPYQENTLFSDFYPRATITQVIQEAMRSSLELKRPFFLGEFGSPKTLGTVAEAAKFQEFLNAIVDKKVQLSALWVYDYSPQDAEWNITQANSRKYQLDAIINTNKQFLVSAGNVKIKDQNLNYSVFPNPAKDFIQLKVNASSSASHRMSYMLFDLQGKLIESNKIESELTNVSIKELDPSVYFIKLVVDNEEVKVFRILKK